jgi:hypothetical protein
VPNRGSAYDVYNAAGAICGPANAGQVLSRRNRIANDFNGDDKRDWNDIPFMMQALANPAAYRAADVIANPPVNAGALCADTVIIEIIGDNNGDGLFNSADARYAADGLAMDPNGDDPGTSVVEGRLDRKVGFKLVDMNWPGGNYFGTTWSNAAPYAMGDSRFDVAGNATCPGGSKSGANNVINLTDVCYVLNNFGDWLDIDRAINIDLSCDMNGDLIVGGADSTPITSKLGLANFGDADGDGTVGNTDLQCVLDSWATSAGDASYNPACDFDCNGNIGNFDLQVILDSWATTLASYKALIGCP